MPHTRGRSDAHGVRWLVILLTAFSMAVHAAAPEDPTAIRALMSAGAVELALARVEVLQPDDPAEPHWRQWETLRCEALARANQGDRLLARVRQARGEIPGICLVEAARAALVQNDSAMARQYAARLLWQRTPSVDEAKAARLTVIDSYIAERRAEDAFRSMLRYQQDYRPLERTTSERFAETLLDFGLDREALGWLPGDKASPARLRLQLRAGTLAPEAAIAQARAALQRESDAGYWRVMHEAALASNNAPAQIEALERLLQSADSRTPDAVNAAAKRLWQGYFSAAENVGNREQLLMGDDAAWADYAARTLGASPFLSRAFFGYLVQRAQNFDIRRNAQLQLAYSLSSSGLDSAALRLMQRVGFDIDALDEQTRYLLGALAAKNNEAAVALRLWEGLTPPGNVNAIEWQLTVARTALYAGDADRSAETLKRLLAGRAAVSPELAQHTLGIAQEMLDMRRLDAARSVYDLVAAVAGDGRAREALFGLARTHELRGDPVAAAAAYLRSALFIQAAAPDALAFQARLLAALNLMRAGFKADARTQFEWLLKNAKDPALTEAARRGLDRL
jgi:hypothetical protein